MAFIFMQSEPPRRQIESEGVLYREVLPGDDTTWTQIVVGGLVFVLIGMPACFAVMVWVLFPIMSWIIKHGPGL